MEVKLRKERDSEKWWAYFIDGRRMIGVDNLGATILDLFFNRDLSRQEVARRISDEFDVSEEAAFADLGSFLDKIEEELSPDRFAVVDQGHTDVPWGVELQITGRCNLRCRHCLQGEYSGHMATERAIRIVDMLSEANVFEISLLGGEPFEHPGIMEILARCHDRDLAINIVTNGVSISDERVAALAERPRLVVFVSLDGLEDDHDFIRGKGMFGKTTATIDRFIERGIETEVLCTLNSRNIGNYRDVLDFCHERGLVCDFNLFKPFRPEHACLIPDPKQFFRAMVDLFDLRQTGRYQLGLANAAIVGKLLGIETKNECRATQSGLVVNNLGQMVTCPSLVEAGYYHADELPAFDDGWLEKWRCHRSFVRFKECGLLNCQAREFVFKRLFGRSDPYSADEFEKFLRTR